MTDAKNKKFLSLKEAVELSEQTLKKAEQERINAAEKEATIGIHGDNTMGKFTQKKIDELEEEKQKIQQEIEALGILLKKYPDLEIIKNRWKTQFYCSKSVNNKVTDYYTGYSCGCCPDSIKQIYFYIVDEETQEKIYSSPECFAIGEREDHEWSEKGYRICDEWKENLRENNISETMIEKLSPLYDDLDDDFDEDPED